MLYIPHNGYAKNRKGEKVGPIQRVSCSKTTDKKGFYYSCAGESWYTHGRNIDNGTEKPIDLIEPWVEQPTGPVITETVTKTRIVPGVYDGVTVSDHPEGVLVRIGGIATGDPARLDAAAAVLSALAKGLRDA